MRQAAAAPWSVTPPAVERLANFSWIVETLGGVLLHLLRLRRAARNLAQLERARAENAGVARPAEQKQQEEAMLEGAASVVAEARMSLVKSLLDVPYALLLLSPVAKTPRRYTVASLCILLSSLVAAYQIWPSKGPKPKSTERQLPSTGPSSTM